MNCFFQVTVFYPRKIFNEFLQLKFFALEVPLSSIYLHALDLDGTDD